MSGSRSTVRLRGTSIAAAPLALLGVIGSALAVATVAWASWGGRELSAVFWITLVFSGATGIGALVAARGCFVEIDETDVRDVVGWVTVRRIDRAGIRTVRVRAGMWRVFVLEFDDGRVLTLLGASPMQFPARLLPDAMSRDLADLDAILGKPGPLDRPDDGSA